MHDHAFAVRRAKDERKALCRAYPNIFSKPGSRARLPLKIGIYHDIVARGLPPGIGSKNSLRRALTAYCTRPTYLRNEEIGATRVDLDGGAAGIVTEAEGAYAHQLLLMHAARMQLEQLMASTLLVHIGATGALSPITPQPAAALAVEAVL